MTASDHLKDFQHEEDCPCFGDVVEHSIDCKNCTCDKSCKLPPEGWICTRGFRHEGPCAAQPRKFWENPHATPADHIKHRTGSLGGDQVTEEAAEALAIAEYQPHRFGDTPAWFAACVRLAKRALTAESALAQKTRECEELRKENERLEIYRGLAKDRTEALGSCIEKRTTAEAQLEQLQRQVAELENDKAMLKIALESCAKDRDELQRQVAEMTEWKPITEENFSQIGLDHEVGYFVDGRPVHIYECGKPYPSFEHVQAIGDTHYRPINPPLLASRARTK